MRVGLHPPQVTPCAEVPGSDASIHVTNDGSGEQEEWENDTAFHEDNATRSLICTYVTTRTEEKKVAKELLTAFKVPASELSIVSVS